LKGSGPRDVTLLCEKLASRAPSLNGAPMEASADESYQRLALTGARKVRQMVEAKVKVIDNSALLPQAALQRVIESPSDGFAARVNAGTVGRVSWRWEPDADRGLAHRSQCWHSVEQEGWRPRRERRATCTVFAIRPQSSNRSGSGFWKRL
jgi:hypothetical protein